MTYLGYTTNNEFRIITLELALIMEEKPTMLKQTIKDITRFFNEYIKTEGEFHARIIDLGGQKRFVELMHNEYAKSLGSLILARSLEDPINSDKTIKLILGQSGFRIDRLKELTLVLTKEDKVSEKTIKQFKEEVINGDYGFEAPLYLPKLDETGKPIIVNNKIIMSEIPARNNKNEIVYYPRKFDYVTTTSIISGKEKSIKALFLNQILKVNKLGMVTPGRYPAIGIAGAGAAGKSSLIKRFMHIIGLNYNGQTENEESLNGDLEDYAGKLTIGLSTNHFIANPTLFMYKDENNIIYFKNEQEDYVQLSINEYNQNTGKIINFWTRKIINETETEWELKKGEEYASFIKETIKTHTPILDYEIIEEITNCRLPQNWTPKNPIRAEYFKK